MKAYTFDVITRALRLKPILSLSTTTNSRLFTLFCEVSAVQGSQDHVGASVVHPVVPCCLHQSTIHVFVSTSSKCEHNCDNITAAASAQTATIEYAALEVHRSHILDTQNISSNTYHAAHFRPRRIHRRCQRWTARCRCTPAGTESGSARSQWPCSPRRSS